MKVKKMNFIRGKQLAMELGVSEKTIYNWFRKGILKKFGAGGCAFYSRSQVIEALIELKPNNFKTSKIQQKKLGS